MDTMRAAIDRFLSDNGMPEEENIDVVVIGGAALYLLGLRENFEDLDLIIPGMDGYKVSTYCDIKIDAGGTYFLGKEDLTETVCFCAISLHGFTVMDPLDIIKQKKFYDRPKDRADLRVLARHGWKQAVEGWMSPGDQILANACTECGSTWVCEHDEKGKDNDQNSQTR